MRRADKACQSVRGHAIDGTISAPLLDRLAPAANNLALAADDEIAARVEQVNAQRDTQLA